LALKTALLEAGSLVLLLSPSLRQSGELFRKVAGFYRRLGRPIPSEKENALSLELDNHSRIVSLPSTEETIRGYSGVSLLVIDEAARVPGELYRSVRPMLATSKGRLVALSTPFGKQGWFYDAWRGSSAWERVRVTAWDCPRIGKDWLEKERREQGDVWFRQEYECCFEQMAGLVYPELERVVIEPCRINGAQTYVGVDWGWNNPAALVVGTKDHDDVLYVVEEVYGSGMTMNGPQPGMSEGERQRDFICRAIDLNKRYRVELFHADPAEPRNIQMFLRASLPTRKGFNRILPGIQAVNTRIRTGRLKVFRNCVNLIEEAGLYRYPDETERKIIREEPLDEHNHALSALRYMVCGIDRVRDTGGARKEPATAPRQPIPQQQQQATPVDRMSNEEWEREQLRRDQRDHLRDHGWEHFDGFGPM
jgi:hypothetical protein